MSPWKQPIIAPAPKPKSPTKKKTTKKKTKVTSSALVDNVADAVAVPS